ncbi:MAG: hypothetical protein ACXVCP_18575 [Bdellovibrio sp.]
MKNVLGRVTAAIILTGGLVLSACSQQSNGTTGFQQKGSVQVLMPLSNSSSGTYSLQIFVLQGIEDLQTVAGHFVHFFMSPSIVNNKLQGSAPKARFIKNVDGAYVPTDDFSQQLVTVYAHMQRMAALDAEMGVGDVNKWPRDIGVAVRVKGGLYNNAFYDGKTDAMLFVPYIDSGLSISINGGILAHEHFHSLFCKRAICQAIAQIHNRSDYIDEKDSKENEENKSSKDETETLSVKDVETFYHMALLRGMNEGLADYWGWMYSGNPDFIALSLPMEKRFRSLDVDDVKSIKDLPSEEIIKTTLQRYYHDLKDKSKFDDFVTSYAYLLGTQFSRAMKRFSDLYAETRKIEKIEARKQVGKILVNVLPEIKTDYENKGDKFYSATQFLKAFVKNVKNMQPDECQFLIKLFTSSAGDKPDKKYSCKEDSEWKILEEAVTPTDSKEPSSGDDNKDKTNDKDKSNEHNQTNVFNANETKKTVRTKT